jgi:phosphoribosyl-AMP cyclohydrolase
MTGFDMIDFNKQGGLVPAVVQEAGNGQVLMLAYMNPESLRLTLETGKAHYWSRSRQKLWLKGATSGHVQLVREVLVDCDGDTLVLRVEQKGPGACHTGYRSCFYRRLNPDGSLVTIGQPGFDPKEVYKK